MPFVEHYPEPSPLINNEVVSTFIIDIVSDAAADTRLWLPRLKADGTEKLIRGTATLDDSEPGQVLNAELLKVSDRSAFTTSALCDFGIGKKISGAWDEASFLTLMDDGLVQSEDYVIGGTRQNPTDRASITINKNEQLNRTSEEGLVLYDPNRTTVSESDFKIIQGEQNASFFPEITAVSDLKLSDIFERIFVDEMGFDSYETDLPVTNWPIMQYQVGMGDRYWDSLKGLIGMYLPVPSIIDNVIYIFDAFKEFQSGFPAPKSITLNVLANEVQFTQEKQRIDGIKLLYIGVENNYDYTTIDFQYPVESHGATRVESELATVQFRKITGPSSSTIIREMLNWESKDTFVDDVQVEESTDFYTFGQGAEYENRRKTVNALLPIAPDMDTLSLQHSRVENEDFVYSSHPFRRRHKYISGRTMAVEGLITSDSDNPNSLGDPAEMEAAISYRSNNYREGQEHFTRKLSSLRETAEPLRDGTARVRTREVDEVNGQVIKDKTEVRAGEIGIHGSSAQTLEYIVFADDNHTRTVERLVELHIGELPLPYGIPLGERYLRYLQTKGRTCTFSNIGYDPALRKGMTVQVKDRAAASMGNFLLLAAPLRVSSGGLFLDISAKEIADTTGPLTYSSWATIITESTSQVFTIPIECDDDSTLAASTVADLLVEARLSGVGGYTNIETGTLDLSPYAGTTQNFDIRVTAGAIAGTQPVRRIFTLTVAGDDYAIDPITENGITVTENSDPVYEYV